MVVIDIPGAIRAGVRVPRDTDEEENRPAQSIALSLPMAPLVRPHPVKEPPTLHHPADSRPNPPTDRPPTRARMFRPMLNRLPFLFPPVGSQWGNSPLARASEFEPFRPTPPRRAPPPERWAYFPASRAAYGPPRRRLTPQPPDPESSSDSDEGGRFDATSTVFTAPSHHYQ